MIDRSGTKHDTSEIEPSIPETAAEWFLLVRDGDLTAEQLSAWLQWLESDKRHKQAFDEIEDVWHGTAQLEPRAGIWPSAALLSNDRYDGIEPVSAWRERTIAAAAAKPIAICSTLIGARAPADNASVWTNAQRRRRWFVGLGLAASIAGITALALPGLMNTFAVHEPRTYVLETGIGDKQTFELTDGSRVAVGGRSLLLVTLSDTRRYVALERGEAFFSVAKDKHRPFVVRAGHMNVTAVGTTFNVRRAGERVVVAVAEGVVSVETSSADVGRIATSPGARANPMVTQLSAGQRAIVVNGESRAERLSQIDTRQVDSWLDGRLQYENEPLGSLVLDLSRYSQRRIEIDDPDVASLRVTGTVFAGDIDRWIDTLQAALPVRVVAQPDGSVKLEAATRR